MFYKNEDIPANFNKVAEISDNYIVWVRESTLNDNTSYNAYIQFLNPSFSYLYTEDYKIRSGSEYQYNAHYTNNGMYSYIDYYDTDFSLSTMQVDDDLISTEDTSRSDCITIFGGQILCCICILWVFKQMSRLFFRGGLS